MKVILCRLHIQNPALSDDIEVTDMALEAMYTNLAVRIAPSLGKSPSPDTKTAARAGYIGLLGSSAHPLEKAIDNRVATGRPGTQKLAVRA